MTTFSISQAREDFAAAIEAAQREPVTISRHGKDVAVVISASRYEELLEAAEELEDIAIFDAAAADNSPALPWDEAKRALGWS